MKRGFGYIISFLEQVAFLGIVTLLVCYFAFDFRFSKVISYTSGATSLHSYFYVYLLSSPIAYVIIILLCALGQKFLGLYEGEYSGDSFIFILVRNFLDDIAFPYYLLKAILGVIFRINNGDSKFGTIFFFILWLINLAFIGIGIKTAFY